MATLIIGIGTSGLGVLEAAQQFNYEFTGKNTPSDVDYVFIDTEKSSNPRSTPLGKNSIHKIPIPLDMIDGKVAQLRKNDKFDDSWFPSEIKVEADSAAAGGRPTYGRLGLWVYYDIIDKYLKKFAEKQGDKKVIVVGSLTGGTGSGICVDLAYLIRYRVVNVDLEAVFMVPSLSDYSESNKVIYENTFQALRSIEYYSIPENIYKVVTPDRMEIEDAKAPYDLVSVVSQDYDSSNNAENASRMKNLSDLIRSVGLYICTLFVPGDDKIFKGIIDERRIDAVQTNRHMAHFCSFGISLAQYPKRMLEEYVALDYCIEIIDSWKSSEVKDDKIQRFAQKSIEQHVSVAIEDKLNPVINNRNLDEYVKFVASQIIDKKFEGHSNIDEYISDLLKLDGIIYTSLQRVLSDAKNSIISGINKDLSDLTKDPKIKALREYLTSISNHLDPNNKKGMLFFWNNKYKLNGDPQKWSSIYTYFVDVLKNGRFGAKFFLQDKEYLEERLNDIILLMKMNLIYSEISNIGQAIVDSNKELYADGKKLVNIDDIKKLDKVLDELVSTSNVTSFTGRKSYIEANNQSFAQVYYYYKSGNFTAEVADIKRKIEGVKQINTSGKDILEETSLYKYLTSHETGEVKDVKELYFKILPSMIKIINDQLKDSDGGNNDIYSLISQHNRNNPITKFLSLGNNNIKYSPPAFMRQADLKGIHADFEISSCLKQLYASKDIDKLHTVANKLCQENNLDSVTISEANPDRNASKIQYFQDSILIYREYSYYGGNGNHTLDNTLIPTRDIGSVNMVKESIIDRLKDADFVEDRLPYFNQLKKNKQFNIKKEFLKSATHDTQK